MTPNNRRKLLTYVTSVQVEVAEMEETMLPLLRELKERLYAIEAQLIQLNNHLDIIDKDTDHKAESS